MGFCSVFPGPCAALDMLTATATPSVSQPDIIQPDVTQRDNDFIVDVLPNAAHDTGARTAVRAPPPTLTPPSGLAALGQKFGIGQTQAIVLVAIAGVAGYLMLRKRK